MAIYEYQGEKFELKDGLSQQEAEVKIKNFLNQEKEKKEDKSPGFFKSFFAGIASGALKIPEGVFSLGAELIDLGLDTDTATGVEEFFDKINPFEEIAEETLTGKLTEGLIQLGIPGVAGYRIGAGLAKRAVNAKRAGQYADKNVVGKSLRERQDIDKDLFKLDLKSKLRIGGGGLLGSTVGEGLAYTEDFGTIGDTIGGPTETNKNEGLEGREEAFRKFTNRFKFAVESGAIGAGLGATISGISQAVKKTPLARQFDRSTIQSKIGAGLNKLTSDGVLGGRAFNILKDGDQAATTFVLKSQQISEDLGQLAEKIAKQGLKVAGGDKQEVFTKFTKLIDERLKDFGDFKKTDFVVDEKGLIVDGPAANTSYSIPRTKTKVNARGREFEVNNPAFQKRQRLHDYMKNTLKASDDDITKLENLLYESRYQIDLNSLRLNESFLKPLIKEAKDVLDEASLPQKELDKVREIKTTLEELSNTFSTQLGKYMNREYKIFKTEKGLMNKLFSDGQFRPTAEIMKKAERVYRVALTQAYKNSDETRRAATNKVKAKFAEEQAAQPQRVDPRVERARGKELQSRIEKQIDADAKDYFENTAPQKAKEAVEMIVNTRGRSLFDKPDIGMVGFKKLLKDEAKIELDEGLFKQRTLKNPVIRELLGEIEDPFYNIANTNSKQAQIMAQLQTHNKLYQDTLKIMPRSGGAVKSRLFFDSQQDAIDAIKILPEYKDVNLNLDNLKDDIVEIKTNNADIVPSVLDGKYTFKPVADAINSTDQMLKDSVLNNLYKWMVLVPKSLSQQAKTIYSPFTHIRNVISAALFTTMNGNILFQNPAQTARLFRAALKDVTGNSALDKARRLRNARLGINGTNPVAGEADRLAKDVGTDFYTGNFNEGMNKTLTSVSKLADKARRAYLAEDNLWKNFNFEAELISIKKNFDALGVTADNIFDPKNLMAYSKLLGRKVTRNDPIFDRVVDISPDGKFLNMTGGVKMEGDKLLETFYENMAAQITKHNIPNYEYVGEFIKTLRRLPLGTFVAFPAEIIRTGYNTIQRGLRELQVEGFKQTGLRRLAGVATTAAVVPAGLVEFGKSLANMTDDEMRALRSFVPSWSTNGLLMPVSRDEETGKVKYMDLSYIFPYDTLIRPVNTILNEAAKGQQSGESLNKYLLDAGAVSFFELSKPFISESIFFEAFADIVARNGRSRDGRQVFRPGDSTGEKIYKGGMHVLETFAPGSVSQINRLFKAGTFGLTDKRPDKYGQVFDMSDEFGGIFGFRAIEADPVKAMPFIVTDFNKKNDSARASFVGDVLKGGFVSPAEIVDQYIKSERVRFQNFKQMHNLYKDALLLGAKRGKVLKELSRVTKAERQAIITGRYLPYTPGEGVRQAFNQNFRELRQELGRDIVNPFNLAYPEIMKIRKNNMKINVNDGDFDSTFVIPEGFKQEEITPPAPPTTTKPISSTAGSVVSGFGGTQNLDSALAIDTLIGDDAIYQELAKQRNT
tara:strand:- start:2303 stop:6763 length:4461 start_codon:yes stop_codon:yes gene_type:complete